MEQHRNWCGPAKEMQGPSIASFVPMSIPPTKPHDDEDAEEIHCVAKTYDQLHLVTNQQLLDSYQRLHARHGTCTKEEFANWQQATGLSYSKYALMLNHQLLAKGLIQPVSQFCHDWMHGILQGTGPIVLHRTLQTFAEAWFQVYQYLERYFQLWQCPQQHKCHYIYIYIYIYICICAFPTKKNWQSQESHEIQLHSFRMFGYFPYYETLFGNSYPASRPLFQGNQSFYSFGIGAWPMSLWSSPLGATAGQWDMPAAGAQCISSCGLFGQGKASQCQWDCSLGPFYEPTMQSSQNIKCCQAFQGHPYPCRRRNNLFQWWWILQLEFGWSLVPCSYFWYGNHIGSAVDQTCFGEAPCQMPHWKLHWFDSNGQHVVSSSIQQKQWWSHSHCAAPLLNLLSSLKKKLLLLTKFTKGYLASHVYHDATQISSFLASHVYHYTTINN